MTKVSICKYQCAPVKRYVCTLLFKWNRVIYMLSYVRERLGEKRKKKTLEMREERFFDASLSIVIMILDY